MYIDMHVYPPFYEPIEGDKATMDYRHEAMDIHKNGIAKIRHIRNQMACAGLDKLCLLPLDYSSVDGRAVVTNEEIQKLVDTVPDIFIGFASVDPLCGNAAEKLEHAFSELGLLGLRLNPGKPGYYPTDERLEPLYQICEKYDKPIIFQTGLSWEPGSLMKYSRPAEFEEVAVKHPKLRICLSQFAWPWVQEAAALMCKYKNIYADTGMLYFDNAREFYNRVFTHDLAPTWIDRSLRHQVMFASHQPRFEQIRMAEALETLGFRDSTLELIRGQNALDFLGKEVL